MASDKQIAEELKSKSANSNSNGKRSSSKEGAKAGANRIADFIDKVSDKVSEQVADATTAAIIEKAMERLGRGNGPMTEQAIAKFEEAFSEVLIDNLPGLAGVSESPKYLLGSAYPEDEDPLN